MEIPNQSELDHLIEDLTRASHLWPDDLLTKASKITELFGYSGQSVDMSTVRGKVLQMLEEHIEHLVMHRVAEKLVEYHQARENALMSKVMEEVAAAGG